MFSSDLNPGHAYRGPRYRYRTITRASDASVSYREGLLEEEHTCTEQSFRLWALSEVAAGYVHNTGGGYRWACNCGASGLRGSALTAESELIAHNAACRGPDA